MDTDYLYIPFTLRVIYVIQQSIDLRAYKSIQCREYRELECPRHIPRLTPLPSPSISVFLCHERRNIITQTDRVLQIIHDNEKLLDISWSPLPSQQNCPLQRVISIDCAIIDTLEQIYNDPYTGVKLFSLIVYVLWYRHKPVISFWKFKRPRIQRLHRERDIISIYSSQVSDIISYPL